MHENLNISDRGIELIKSFEGLMDGDPSTINLDPYLCPAGYWTIGWGHVVRFNGEMLNGRANKKLAYSVYPKGITVAEADVLLRNDLRSVAASMRRMVKVPLDENQFNALVSFTFNLGQGNLAESTLLRLLNDGHYDDVPAQLLRWTKGTDPNTGKKVNLPGLERRRAAEGKLWNLKDQ